jgi:hypothetical protein
MRMRRWSHSLPRSCWSRIDTCARSVARASNVTKTSRCTNDDTRLVDHHSSWNSLSIECRLLFSFLYGSRSRLDTDTCNPARLVLMGFEQDRYAGAACRAAGWILECIAAGSILEEVDHGRAGAWLPQVPWTLLKRGSTTAAAANSTSEVQQQRKRVYVCPEESCLHHNACHALGDLVGIRKHYRRKHSTEKQWQCTKCSKEYAVQSDYKAHQKTCGTRGHSCDCGRVFSR